MFTSPICKHINKWGKNSGNICGKPSKKKDSRCHKHRYRFIRFLTNIYKSFKYLFEIKPVVIKNKKQIKKILKKRKEEDFQNKLEYEKENNKEIFKVYKNETFNDYVNRMDDNTEKLLKTNDKEIVNKLVINKLYSVLNTNYNMGTREWTVNSNMILCIKRKYNFF